MSGPKVVNIQALRRRQRRECNALLRELAAAIDACLQFQDSAATTTAEFKATAAKTIEGLDTLRAAEQWQMLRTQTTAQRDFYRREAEDLRQRHVEARTITLRREHNLRQGALQLRTELARLPASPARESALHALADASDAAALQSAVAHAVDLVASHRDQTDDALMNHIRVLAAEFAEPAAAATTAASLPHVEPDADELRLRKCCALLGELETIPHVPLADWKNQAARAAAATASDRPLLLDSLALNLTSYLRECRARQKAVADAQALVPELTEVVEREGETWRARLTAALVQPVVTARLQELNAAARRWLDEELARHDAQAQRAAVLHALAALGYEVREGMAAAWTDQGRIVIHKPDNPAYGVELSAPPVGSNIQVRVVAVGHYERSKQRDLEVEQAWCGEFARLQSLLATDGFPTQLTQAQAPGAVPMKVLPRTTSRPESRPELRPRTFSSGEAG